MAFVHGKKAYFAIDTSSGGSLGAIDEYLNDVSLPRNFETAETTTFGGDDKTYIIGLGDATISASGLYDSTLDGYLQAHLAATGTSISFEFRPNEGSVSATNPKFTGECFITSYDISPSVGDAIPISIDFQVTGAVTRATS
jgi:hypothetical protein